MNDNSWQILKSIPKWKMCIYVLLSICLALSTLYLLEVIFWGLDVTSVTFHTVRVEFSKAYGPRHLERLVGMLYYFLHFIFILLYIVLFYMREKRLYLKRYFNQILEEIRLIGNINFEHEINVLPNTQLGDLAKEINNIAKQLKVSIEEERRIEQTKKDLITNVSHDLRTPLTSIVGYVSFIQQDKYRDEIELRYYIEIIHDKVLRLNHLMNDLFEYTRFQNKGIHLHKDPIYITEMLEQLVVQYRFDIKRMNMEFREFLSSRDLMVLADGDKLVRVFENLIVNAMRYGADGKYIDITVREVDDTVAIEITNYGDMIPAADLPYIFERFYRVEKSRSTYTGGSGLGLAIAKSIVELHDGTIEVRSDAAQTTFTVKLKVFRKEVSLYR
ncbi:histidine kinase [Bacillus manliponensis]|uniref:histidine kinase n=1 Tax=Bacillus manliponensis TaxID=574376 RepID=A0A073K0D0_9BACI|nr:ATP-binding protein [Bacillus manliponensis]KEK19902.1 histidine kinase [Bacillus manliponensis]